MRHALASQQANASQTYMDLEGDRVIGLRAFVVHAKDDDARAFYEQFDFMASPSDPFHLFILIEELRPLLS